MWMPSGRGPVSSALVQALSVSPHELPTHLAESFVDGDAITDEDLQLTLFLCYELHYRGWTGVDPDWEWEPSLLALRAVAERRFEAALRALVGPIAPVAPSEVPRALGALVDADDGPSLARHLQSRASMAQFREFVTHRSIYHLREADPHTWAIPRLDGRAKAALIEIQMDEYGGGRFPRMHAELFRTTMAGLDLDTTYGRYVEVVPAITLATNNVTSLFGLHRRLRGAVLGHLAALEMTSSLPNRRYGNGLRRLGATERTTHFYDEHVEADAVHEQIAANDMCGSFATDEPERAVDVLFGAACALAVERLFAVHLLSAWEHGGSSLRTVAAVAS
ncbi:MAG TPA: iron-containing redox enzyme family protein [Micromonosporaceae bacterium]|nr:iron-containing redox enzyme family protein [Micromonosporaceae bacterium]